MEEVNLKSAYLDIDNKPLWMQYGTVDLAALFDVSSYTMCWAIQCVEILRAEGKTSVFHMTILNLENP